MPLMKERTARLLGCSWGEAHLKNMQTNSSGVGACGWFGRLLL